MTERPRCRDFHYMNSRRNSGLSRSPRFRREQQTLVTYIGVRKRSSRHDRQLLDLHRKATFIDSNDFSAFFEFVDIHRKRTDQVVQKRMEIVTWHVKIQVLQIDVVDIGHSEVTLSYCIFYLICIIKFHANAINLILLAA